MMLLAERVGDLMQRRTTQNIPTLKAFEKLLLKKKTISTNFRLTLGSLIIEQQKEVNYLKKKLVGKRQSVAC